MAQASRKIKVDKKGPYIQHLGKVFRLAKAQDHKWVTANMLPAGQMITVVETSEISGKGRVTSRLNATKIYWDQE